MNESGEATRRAILAAARELFARHGYRGASVRAITSRARANLGAITYHFGSKEGLYRAVLADSVGGLVERLRRARSSPGTPAERLTLSLRSIFDHLQERKEIGPLLLQELSLNRPLPIVLRRAFGENLRNLGGLVREGQRSGELAAGDATLYALSILAQPIFLTIARRPLKEILELDRDREETQTRVVEHVVQTVGRSLGIGRSAR